MENGIINSSLSRIVGSGSSDKDVEAPDSDLNAAVRQALPS